MQQPLFVPEATWRPPNILPELDTVIAIDETCDPNLKRSGPGYKRNDGKVIGIAIADKHHTLYLPFDHLSGDNLDKGIIVSYVKMHYAIVMRLSWLMHRMTWLAWDSSESLLSVGDIQIAEALIDEECFSYSLNNLAKNT